MPRQRAEDVLVASGDLVLSWHCLRLEAFWLKINASHIRPVFQLPNRRKIAATLIIPVKTCLGLFPPVGLPTRRT